jgi:capsular polysaccharide biosynthesis protein
MSHPDHDSLQAISSAVIEILQTRSQDYFPQLGGEPAQVTLLDEPIIVVSPAPIVNRLEPFIRIGLAFIVGVGLAFLMEYLDSTLRTREELEQAGFKVLGTIPKH